MAEAKWLLIETFGGGTPPSVIAMGRNIKPFMPLDRILHNRIGLTEARRALDDIAADHVPIDRISTDGRRRTIAVPVAISPTRLHGVMLWSGHPDTEVPPRDPAGAWVFNLDDSTDTRSDDLLDLLGVPPSQRCALRRHSIADVFGSPFVVNTGDQLMALARLVRAEHGTNTQSLWALRHPGGELRALHYSCRQLTETGTDGTTRKMLRGITYDIGPATDIPTAPPPAILEHRVLEAVAAEGEYRAIIHPRTLHLLQWIGPPMPGIAWQGFAAQPAPALHPDDIDAARAMVDGLRDGRTSGRIRVRALDGTWTALDARATLIALDHDTTAALVTLRHTAAPDRP
ncbi:GAF domain-containing protein [Nocardia wallacei]|uniref:GAF domain-containing protein n=1 Tax=Nocardia wallacei TaxID=480035 RepID=UPI0024579A37|nr:GAF domain-containing protein [Nocardia wallacei]